MSQLIATVTKIENIDNLNIVTFDFFDNELQMMSLDLSNNIQIGTKVILTVKPTHIGIAKDFNGNISYANQLNTTIKECNNGKLLSSIVLEIKNTTLESIITLNSSQLMDLKVGNKVTAFINASELSILKIADTLNKTL